MSILTDSFGRTLIDQLSNALLDGGQNSAVLVTEIEAMTSIVQVGVSLIIAPTPPTLQRTGAILSLGGTSATPGTLELLTQLADLLPLLTPPKGISSIVWSGGAVTVTASAPHNLPVGEHIQLTIAGAAPNGFNGSFSCNITGASTFTYPHGGTIGTSTANGTWVPSSAVEVTKKATTYFAQGSLNSVYVLELGAVNTADGVAALSSWIILNPRTVYAYLVPYSWDGVQAFLDLTAEYQAFDSLTYFVVTTSMDTFTDYTALMNNVLAEVEAPQTDQYPTNPLLAISWSGGTVHAITNNPPPHGVNAGDLIEIAGCVPTAYNGWFTAIAPTFAAGYDIYYKLANDPGAATTVGTLIGSQVQSAGVAATEASAAATFYDMIQYNPSGTNKVAPLAFKFQFGVTPIPDRGNSALKAILQGANINYVDTGAEGGISDAIIVPGLMMDGNPWTFRYAIDWMNINCHEDLANEVINGSNNPVNPLYYNQDGINRLQARVVQRAKAGISFGMIVGTVAQVQMTPDKLSAALNAGQFAGQAVINAIPFVDYSLANPGDYKIGLYKGLSALIIPQLGFQHILLNLVASNLLTL